MVNARGVNSMDSHIVYLIRIESHVTGILSRVVNSDYDMLAVGKSDRLTLFDVYTDTVIEEGLDVKDILDCNLVRSIATARISDKALRQLRSMYSVSIHESLLRYFKHYSSTATGILRDSIISKSSSSEVDALNLNATSIHVHYERCFMAFCSLLPTLVTVDRVYDLVFRQGYPQPAPEAPQDLSHKISIKSRNIVLTFSSLEPDLSTLPIQELNDIVTYINSLESRTDSLLSLSRAAMMELSRRR